MSIEFLYYFNQDEVENYLEKIKLLGYKLKIYMSGNYSHLEGPEMYGKLVRLKVDTLITDDSVKLEAFNLKQS